MCVFSIASSYFDDYDFDIFSILGFVENVLLENDCGKLLTNVIIGGDFNLEENNMMCNDTIADFLKCMNMSFARNNVKYILIVIQETVSVR